MHMNWLHWSRKNDAAIATAFCFPYAGTGISAYSGWAERLQPGLDICIVVPPGREIRYREPAMTNIKPLVDAAAEAISTSLDRPFVLFGHSFGALVAFEVARALRRHMGRTPEIVFVSAAPAPQCAWPHQNLHQLHEDEFIKELRRLYDGLPQAILDDPELRSIVLPALRADLTVVETYTYVAEPPLACPISAFGGRYDRAIKPGFLSEWRHQTSDGFRFYEISGDHFYLRSARDELARLILADVLEQQSRYSSAWSPQGDHCKDECR
jgi:medium-chain acyl-[acyl-carrier-protein] hydrolase